MGRREGGVAHQSLMPCAIPVRPEACLDVNRKARHSDDAPQHCDATNFLGAGKWLRSYLATGPNNPSVPNAGERTQGDQFAPEKSAIVQREFAARGIQSRRKCEFVIPEPQEDVGSHHQAAAPEQRPPTYAPVTQGS